MRSIKQMFKEQELVVGLTLKHVCSPWIAKVYADAGADFVFVENEHMFFNEAELAGFILTCRLCDLPVVAKTTYVDRGNIAKLLDAGVMGVQLPWSESAEQLRDMVKYTKFPPLGIRSASPGIGNTRYEEPVDAAAWLKQANKETTVIAHVETKTGLEHVDEILAVPGVEIMNIGMFDLTVSLGHPVDYAHPEFMRAMERLIAAAKEHGVQPGIWVASFEQAKPWIDKGVRFLETSGDLELIANGAVELIQQFPGHGRRKSGR